MIQYLVILLDDTSVSFCHYGNAKATRRLMPLETLKAGILYGMKENLNIQFVYPAYALPEAYDAAIESIDHVKIKPVGTPEGADVLVMNGWKECEGVEAGAGVSCVLRLPKAEWFGQAGRVAALLEKTERLNVVLTDVETFTEDDFKAYNVEGAVDYSSGVITFNDGDTEQDIVLADSYTIFHNDDGDAETWSTSQLERNCGEDFTGTIYVYEDDDDMAVEIYVEGESTDVDPDDDETITNANGSVTVAVESYNPLTLTLSNMSTDQGSVTDTWSGTDIAVRVTLTRGTESNTYPATAESSDSMLTTLNSLVNEALPNVGYNTTSSFTIEVVITFDGQNNDSYTLTGSYTND